MGEIHSQIYSAFDGHTLLAQGGLEEVALLVKDHEKKHPTSSILVFSDLTGKQMDFDLRGTKKEILQRLQVYISPPPESEVPAGPGRPKLGVVAREVSLLPRHWEWLATQSGGASATLRRLIETAMKVSDSKETIRQSQERTYKFLSAIAGNLPLYEEALRALYSRDLKKFKEYMTDWPSDIKAHAQKLSEQAFEKN